jgi:hypothetical protein
MTFAFARIGAMRVEDYYSKGKRWWIRLYQVAQRLTVAFTSSPGLSRPARLNWPLTSSRPVRQHQGELVLHEKGGKRHEMPAHHNLESYLGSYIETAGIGMAGIRDAGRPPLFRSAAGRSGTLTEKSMNRVDAWRMVQRRASDLGTG